MVDLIFLACLLTAPEACEEKSMQFIDVTPMTCMMGAQPVLARWAVEHPQWQVTSWKCRDASRREVRI